MLRAFVIFLALLTPLSIHAEDGLFVGKGSNVRQSFEDDHLVLRVPVQKVAVTDIVFRGDTENPKVYWLELHMTEYRDPGDFIYCLVAGGQLIEGQMVVRASDRTEGGCKWALQLTDPNAGRRFKKALRRAYDKQ
jgi:hypothetical protein